MAATSSTRLKERVLLSQIALICLFHPTLTSSDVMPLIARAIPQRDVKLSCPTFETKLNWSLTRCAQRCAASGTCLSFNWGQGKCEMLTSYLCDLGICALASAPGFRHYDVDAESDVVVTPMSSAQCQTNGRCSPKCVETTTTATTTTSTTTTATTTTATTTTATTTTATTTTATTTPAPTTTPATTTTATTTTATTTPAPVYVVGKPCSSAATCQALLTLTTCLNSVCACATGVAHRNTSSGDNCVTNCTALSGYGSTYHVRSGFGFTATLHAQDNFYSISMSQCQANCLAQTAYVCRSAGYDVALQTCHISPLTCHDVPSKCAANVNRMYFTRNCA